VYWVKPHIKKEEVIKMAIGGMRMRYVVEPKKPAEYISTEELQRKIAELREAQKPRRDS
jgi:hypothetical protein